jgi:hypothetical protein
MYRTQRLCYDIEIFAILPNTCMRHITMPFDHD